MKDRKLCFCLGYGSKSDKKGSHLIPVAQENTAPALTTVSFMNLLLLEEYEDE